MKRAFLFVALFAVSFGVGYAHAGLKPVPPPPIILVPGPGPVVAPCGWQVCYQEYGACEQDAVETCCSWGACGDRGCEDMLGVWCEYWLEQCMQEDCPSDPPGNPGLHLIQ